MSNIERMIAIKNFMEKENQTNCNFYEQLCDKIEYLKEDTSATGGPAVTTGMGAVVNAQPSSLPGEVSGDNWAANGGSCGSGDVDMPFGATSQKLPANRVGNDSRNNNRLRKKKILAKMRAAKKEKEKPTKKSSRILNFSDFIKNSMNKITYLN